MSKLDLHHGRCDICGGKLYYGQFTDPRKLPIYACPGLFDSYCPKCKVRWIPTTYRDEDLLKTLT